MEFIFASHNEHKLQEVRATLAPRHLVTSLASLGWSHEIPETQDSLLGNALLKARTVYKELGANCFADDTGLEIEALGGKPGVYTARFAGAGATAKENREKTLRLMADQENRRALFRTVIALILDGQEHTFEGCISGKITTSEQGLEGFGYDCIFKPVGFSQTFAELPFEQKARISHRGQAVAKLCKFLETYT